MRGSGLSIERFIKGKAQRQRQYAKVKKREGSASTSEVGDSATGSSFYDRFFRELKSGDADEDVEEEEVRRCCCCGVRVVGSLKVAGAGGSSR